MHSHSYIKTAKTLIHNYEGVIPFSVWSKQFFRTDKKFGSKDRKQITHACYCYFRLGSAFRNLDIEERILTAIFLCSDSSVKILEELRPAWNEIISLALEEKIKFLSANTEVQDVFPFSSELTRQINHVQFNLSFWIQPDLYLRIRPGKNKKVFTRLENSGIGYSLLNNDCIQLLNQSKVDDVLNIDEDVVIQDYNSQRTIDVLKYLKFKTSDSKLSVWDCCAASGGKSILFHDFFPGAQLTVSDVRESILINLQKRFKRAGIKNYDWLLADISSADFSIQRRFDVVICDAPCSGSGTWSRTPEQLHFFTKERIGYYANLQKKIVTNTSKALKKGGYFLYITCSVFKKENEEIVEFMQKNLPLQFQSMQYLNGYDKKADTLFAALFLAL